MRDAAGATLCSPRGWAATALVLSLVALVLFALAPKGTAIDYAVFHRAGARWLRGEELYRLSEVPFPFKYAPIGAALFAPLSLLPLRLGWLATNFLSIVALLRVMRWAAARLSVRPVLSAQAMVLGVAAPWYGHLLWLGQTDGLIVWLLVESEDRAERAPLASGGLWALACLMKPPFLVLLLPVVLCREWRRLVGLCVGGASLLALGALRFGLAGGWAEVLGWRALLASSTAPMLCWEFNQSVFALTCTYVASIGSPAFLPAVVALSALVLLAGLAAIAVVLREDRSRGRFALGAFSLYLGAFFSPLGWNTNLVAGIPLTWALAAGASGEVPRKVRRGAWVIASLVALLNCVDLLLLPIHPWEDTTMQLLWYRQYGVAGMLLAAGALGSLVAITRPRPRGAPLAA